MISVSKAIQEIISTTKTPSTEQRNLKDCLGYTLAENIYSDRDYPPFNRSAMDGYVLKNNFFSNEKKYYIQGKILAGEEFIGELDSNSCLKIMTGAPVPKDLDVVIKIEDGILENSHIVSFPNLKIKPFQNIARQGEDLKQTELAVKSGVVCNTQVLSLCATLGKTKLLVYKKPKVTIFSTGNEVCPLTQTPKVYQIRDSNSYAIFSFLYNLGITPIGMQHLLDEPSQIQTALEQALESSDCIIFSGGVSMGEADFLPKIFQEMNIKKIFHKVNIKPGKPIWYGISKNNCAIFGLPGNPLSVQITFKLFVEPWILSFTKAPLQLPIYLPIKERRFKKEKLNYYFPVVLISENEKTFLQEVKYNGSGDVKSALFSDGFAVHSDEKEEVLEGEFLPFYFWKS